MTGFTEFIARRPEAIVDRWAEEAGRLAAARGLSRPELRNILPKYLASLGASEESGGEQRRLLDTHFSARIRAGFQLAEVLEELAILGRCVAAAGAEGGFAPEEVAHLVRVLHRDANAAVAAFTQHLLEDEQEEKRYLRRLQALAGGALRGGPEAPGLEARLKEVLELVMEAMGAQSAALLLYDAETQSLWTAASAGVAEEPMARYATTEGADSFAASVASREDQATALADVATTELDVSEALRRSGVHALLGVRLPERHTLLGVMYVGLAERRPFTPREVRRLETLGEQLALHLDNARLYATLRATVEDLRVEHALRERFISVLAHDLRGPLSVVQTSAHLLCGDAERLGDHRELPLRSLRSARRAARMVDDLLDVLRVRAGHGLPLTLGECDLAEVVRSTVEELTTVHGDRFALRCATQVHGVWDADALHRALWNLCTNAVKYGSPEAPVGVTVRRLPDGGAEIAVHNEGPVIPPEARAALFEPFARGDAGASGERRGWGLGLSLVESCARAHGGRVELESAPGRGTTFTLTLPQDARPFQPAA